ncbi:UDP-glucose dehydrogenase family protein [Granulicella tundricola]|uniref:UDP-glucose 6-dehydrogenase n=1 Tax=Granulicella tundricola (strain ATCC BAA-1859 / DSM 23138 / MP5ACTX9) TaxID=1198114 RepID=E8WVF7_GRATM|nr:UDP-glucose/GDP-mannose dehydrogenase family protein [Granulicella tundricola]ADW68405.1 nucleotide sugar dehydrogenase [Granulicella tundricola MP5ACTX9]
MAKDMQIAVVGSGYVGLVAAVCFAEMGHDVICVDNDERKVAALQGGDTLIHEDHLPELLNRYRNTKVRFMTDLAEATRESQAIFIAVGTPQSETGDADLSYVEAVACEIARSINSYKVIVEKSTVPVYTNEWIRKVMERNGVARDLFDVVSNPEFLREGSAVSDFLHPDRIVVGSDTARAAAVLAEVYAPLTTGAYYTNANLIPGVCSVAAPPVLLNTSTKSAEIIKHASNAFLALKISFINAVSNLCEATDANVEQVARGMGLDSRIGPKFLRPGIGYGGSCFPKDVAAFRSVAEQLGIDFSLLTEVEKINESQKKRFLSKVRSALWTLRGKRIGVLGLAFKGETDDIRESPAIDLVEMLLAEGCSVAAYDPAAIKRTEEIMPASTTLRYASSSYDAAQDADALLILTDWQEFATLDLTEMHKALRYPIVIDGRNLYDPSVMLQHGFTYLSVGRPAAHPIHNLRRQPVTS